MALVMAEISKHIEPASDESGDAVWRAGRSTRPM
jgi:hypothetical protein